ncbi:MAG TPA: lycopene cyclase family protein [Allosphingosinicella sp.]|nr:lycopene cyclase family protein [Allosphingosinicella sp.]
MRRGKNCGLLIAGGGVAGCFAALAMARMRPDAAMVLVGEEVRFGGGSGMLVLDAGLAAEERELLAPVVVKSWDSCYVSLPTRSRKLKLASHLVTTEAIHQAVADALPDRCARNAKVVAIRDDSLLLPGGETIAGTGAIDARGWALQTTLEIAWRHRTARTCRFADPHRVDLPVLADLTLETGGCGHFTCIPIDPHTLRIERIDYSRSAEGGADGVDRIADYVARRRWHDGEPRKAESSSRPVTLGGDFAAFWRIGGARVAKLGARGGFSHPFTGSALPDALRTSLALVRHSDLSGSALHDLFESEAATSWKRREFHRTVNRHLLDKGAPALAALYDLDPALLERFFAEELKMFDRRKILAAVGG